MAVDITSGGVLFLGLMVGVRHAMEADHVAAVSSLVSGVHSWRSAARHGAFWGAGHTITLSLVAGTAVFLGAGIGDGLAGWLEFSVGVMLTLLGGSVIWRLIRDRVHFHAHSHGDGTVHLHAHSHAGESVRAGAHKRQPHDHGHPRGIPWRTLGVGLMHGMAGSAALVVLTASQIKDPLIGVAYIVLFGVGSIAGMAMLSAVIAVPLGWTAKSMTRVNNLLQGAIGFGTVILGLHVVYATQGAVLLR